MDDAPKIREPEFLDPNDFAVLYLSRIKRQITQAIDYRLSTLEKSSDLLRLAKMEELENIHKFVRGLLYEKDSWKEMFPDKDSTS